MKKFQAQQLVLNGGAGQLKILLLRKNFIFIGRMINYFPNLPFDQLIGLLLHNLFSVCRAAKVELGLFQRNILR